MTLTLACVLRSGGDYTPEHVEALRRALPDLDIFCFTDVSVRGPRIPLKHAWPGWWSKMEILDVSLLAGDVLYFDLDTVFVGPLDDVIRLCEGDRPIILRDFYLFKRLQASVMYLPEAARADAWDAWMDAQSDKPMGYMQSDQTFMDRLWRDTARRWQDELPGQFVSYKVHCQDGVPEGARVVVFHGQPRPWSTPLWKAAA